MSNSKRSTIAIIVAIIALIITVCGFVNGEEVKFEASNESGTITVEITVQESQKDKRDIEFDVTVRKPSHHVVPDVVALLRVVYETISPMEMVTGCPRNSNDENSIRFVRSFIGFDSNLKAEDIINKILYIFSKYIYEESITITKDVEGTKVGLSFGKLSKREIDAVNFSFFHSYIQNSLFQIHYSI